MKIFLLLVLCFAACDQKPKAVSKVLEDTKKEYFSRGESAPDFDLEKIVDLTAGKTLPRQLSSLKGKPIVLNFWATWCTPCIKELPSLERLNNKLGEKINVITVNTDQAGMKAKVFDLLKQNKYTFDVFLDPELYTVESFRLSGFPETFLLDSKGTFRKITDPETGESVVRVLSEREWDSKQMISAIEEAIKD